MTSLKIASWNVNSVRARIAIVERFLREEAPDVLCLQEVEDQDALEAFVRDDLVAVGAPYRYAMCIEGNDHRDIEVALLSRLPLGRIAAGEQVAAA